MNILYISRIFGCPWGGPTHSVPSQVAAQTNYDNIFWYNVVNASKSEWRDTLYNWKQLKFYADLEQFPNESIRELPSPFNNPDLIIVEQFYKFARSKIVRELITNNYKYILIPRGELTSNAQSQKKLKKTIFNILYFEKFAKKSVAIQYLTKREQYESTEKWNQISLVIPNGTALPKEVKKNYTDSKKIRIVSIGRISVFHKGIDILLGACEEIKNELMRYGCKFYLYGPDEDNVVTELRKELQVKGIDIIVEIMNPVNDIEKNKVLTSADIFIMTSRFEGHPTGLLEALSYGLPCLVTDGSNMREEIEESDAGWGADNTVDSVSAAIIKMLNELDKIPIKSRNAYKLAKRYSWDAIAKKSHDEYLKLIKR